MLKKIKTPVFFMFLLFSFSYSGITQASTTVEHNSQATLEEALKDQLGNVVYLDFWASWCGPCRKSFPWMNILKDKYSGQGFTVISINLDADKRLAEKFLQETPANFRVIYDPKGKIARHFKIQGMPSSMLIGRDGKVKHSHSGFFTKKIPEYQQQIEKMLLTK